MNNALEGGRLYRAVFLDVAQAFDKVWNTGFINKIGCLLPHIPGEIQYKAIFSEQHEIRAGILQAKSYTVPYPHCRYLSHLRLLTIR